MQAQTQLMPGYRLDEYLMVLTPHEDLRNRIMTIKKEFGEKYRSQLALSSKPHLTLAKFVSWNMNEERIINKFQRLAMGVTPFRVELPTGLRSAARASFLRRREARPGDVDLRPVADLLVHRA